MAFRAANRAVVEEFSFTIDVRFGRGKGASGVTVGSGDGRIRIVGGSKDVELIRAPGSSGSGL